MAITLQHQETQCRWGIWKTDESIEELLALLPSPEGYAQELLRFTSSHRRLEWLSVRVLLYTLLGEQKEIAYYPNGKPYLSDHSFFISISHTHGYVAVILSSTAEVGIDIEQYGTRVHKVAHKYMRPDEVTTAYQGDTTWSLLLHWSAKEVLFKCMNTSEVDFREHLHILPFEVEAQGEFRAKEYRTAQKKEFLIHYLIGVDYVMTWNFAV